MTTGNQYDQRGNNNSRDDRRDDRPRDRGFDDRGRDDYDRGGGGEEEGESDRSSLMPEGRYPGRRVEHALAWTGKEGDANRKEQIAILFEFLAPAVIGRTMTYYGFFTDKTLEGTLKTMRNLGWKGNDPNAGWPGPEEEQPTVDLVVQHEKNLKGRWIARIRWVNGGGIAAKSKMNDADKASFAKRIGGIAARLAAQEGGGDGRDERQLRDPRDQRNDQRNDRGDNRQTTRGRNDEPPPPSDDDAPPFQRNRQRDYNNDRR